MCLRSLLYVDCHFGFASLLGGDLELLGWLIGWFKLLDAWNLV